MARSQYTGRTRLSASTGRMYLPLAFLIAFGRMWLDMGGMGMAAALGVLYGILWGLGYIADRLLSPQLRGFSSTLVYPFTVGTVEKYIPKE